MGQPKNRDSRGFTPTEARIIAVLQDGLNHTSHELCRAIDSQAGPGNLAWHIINLRKTLETRFEVIVVTQNQGTTYYRYGRLMAPMENG